jgi:hypothetical protein
VLDSAWSLVHPFPSVLPMQGLLRLAALSHVKFLDSHVENDGNHPT